MCRLRLAIRAFRLNRIADVTEAAAVFDKRDSVDAAVQPRHGGVRARECIRNALSQSRKGTYLDDYRTTLTDSLPTNIHVAYSDGSRACWPR